MSAVPSKTSVKVIELFEECRENPKLEFDESHFLDFLTDPPKALGGFRDSFAALRRYNRFIDAIQLEFTVYFSKKDRDTNFSVDRFVARIDTLRRNPNASSQSLRNAMRHSDPNVFLVGNLLGGAILVPLYSYPIGIYVLLFVVASLNLWGISYVVRSHRYEKSLLRALGESKLCGPDNVSEDK